MQYWSESTIQTRHNDGEEQRKRERTRGKFHGIIAPTTPQGSCLVYASLFSLVYERTGSRNKSVRSEKNEPGKYLHGAPMDLVSPSSKIPNCTEKSCNVDHF